MANDRIRIKCRKCGEEMTFAKYYPTLGHGIWSSHIPYLEEFVSKHMECSPYFGGDSLNGDRCFDLFTESEIVLESNGLQ